VVEILAFEQVVEMIVPLEKTFELEIGMLAMGVVLFAFVLEVGMIAFELEVDMIAFVPEVDMIAFVFEAGTFVLDFDIIVEVPVYVPVHGVDIVY